MAAMTLEDVVKQLQSNNRTTGDVVKTLKDFINMSKRNSLDALEAEREKKKKTADDVKAGAKTMKSPDVKGNMGLAAIFAGMGLKSALLKISTILVAGTAALVLAFEGLRGWEADQVKKIKGLLKLPTVVSNGMIKLRNGVLGMFGLTAEGLPIKQADGTMGKSMSIQAQVAQKFANMKKAFLLNFGIGADGKNVGKVGPKGMTKQPLHVRAGRAMIRLLSPLSNMVSGLANWFKGAGAKIMNFAKAFLGGGGGVLKLMGKILWPIGIILSLFDGVTAFKDEKGTFYDKLGAGIGGFIGSFIGAPFDLLKGAINWLLKKIFPGLTTEDGKWDESTVLGSWLSKFEGFSIAEMISNLVKGMFALPKKAIEWIKGKFSIGVDFFTNAWQALLKKFSTPEGAVAGLIDLLMWPVNAAVNFVRKMFGWSEDDAPAFSVGDFVVETFGKIVDWFKKLPERIMLTIREFTTAAIAGMKLDFMNLVDMLKSIPAKIKLYAQSVLPKIFGGISDAEYEKKLAELSTPDEARLAERQAIIDELRKDLANIASEREALNAPANNVDNSDKSTTTVINAEEAVNVEAFG